MNFVKVLSLLTWIWQSKTYRTKVDWVCSWKEHPNSGTCESGALAVDHLSGESSHWCTSKTDVFSLKFRETAWKLVSVPSHHQDSLTGTNWKKVKMCTEENRMKSKLLENFLLCSHVLQDVLFSTFQMVVSRVTDLSPDRCETSVIRTARRNKREADETQDCLEIYVVFRWRTAPLIPSPANNLFMQPSSILQYALSKPFYPSRHLLTLAVIGDCTKHKSPDSVPKKTWKSGLLFQSVFWILGC